MILKGTVAYSWKLMTHDRFSDESGNKEDLKDAEVDARLEKLVAEVSAIVDVSDNQGKTYASLQCRSIRIGSYKSMPKEKAAVTENAIQIKVPAIGNRKYNSTCFFPLMGIDNLVIEKVDRNHKHTPNFFIF
jgi:hypothetical protein